MPYTDDPVNTKSVVPAKLFQYLACGRPVISNLLPKLINLPEKFVYQASSEQEFILYTKKSVNEDTHDLYNQRINFAMNHDWESRGREITETIMEDLKICAE